MVDGCPSWEQIWELDERSRRYVTILPALIWTAPH